MNFIPGPRSIGECLKQVTFRIPWFIFRSITLFIFGCGGCTLFASRPVQEMSFTSAAIRASREVQADTLAPELFRQSNEWFFQAKREYKFKNFKLAKKYADKARFLAEQAEFEALRNGGIRSDQSMSAQEPLSKDPMQGGAEAGMGEGKTPSPQKPGSYAYPTPEGTPADEYEKRKTAEEKAAAPPPSPSNTPVPVTLVPESPQILPQPMKSTY